jgi:hypothetical protein
MLRFLVTVSFFAVGLLMFGCAFASSAGLGMVLFSLFLLCCIFNACKIKVLATGLFAFVALAVIGLILHACGIPFFILGIIALGLFAMAVNKK